MPSTPAYVWQPFSPFSSLHTYALRTNRLRSQRRCWRKRKSELRGSALCRPAARRRAAHRLRSRPRCPLHPLRPRRRARPSHMSTCPHARHRSGAPVSSVVIGAALCAGPGTRPSAKPERRRTREKHTHCPVLCTVLYITRWNGSFLLLNVCGRLLFAFL